MNNCAELGHLLCFKCLLIYFLKAVDNDLVNKFLVIYPCKWIISEADLQIEKDLRSKT